jgi:hypothetical protein
MDADETGWRIYSTWAFNVVVLTPQLLNEEQKCVRWNTTMNIAI